MHLIILLIVLCPIVDSQTLQLDKETYFRYDILNATLVDYDQSTVKPEKIFIGNTNGKEEVYDIVKKELVINKIIYQQYILEAAENFITLYNIDYPLNSALLYFSGMENRDRFEVHSEVIKIKAIPAKKRVFDHIRGRNRVIEAPEIMEKDNEKILLFAVTSTLSRFEIHMCHLITPCEKFDCTSDTCEGTAFNTRIKYSENKIEVHNFENIDKHYYLALKYTQDNKDIIDFSLIIPPYNDKILIEYVDENSFTFEFKENGRQNLNNIIFNIEEDLPEKKVKLAKYIIPSENCKDGSARSKNTNNINLYHHSDKNLFIVSVNCFKTGDANEINEPISFLIEKDSSSVRLVEDMEFEETKLSEYKIDPLGTKAPVVSTETTISSPTVKTEISSTTEGPTRLITTAKPYFTSQSSSTEKSNSNVVKAAATGKGKPVFITLGVLLIATILVVGLVYFMKKRKSGQLN